MKIRSSQPTKLTNDEEGTTAVEYAVMLALIAAVCVGSVQFLTSKTKESFDKSGNAINGAMAN